MKKAMYREIRDGKNNLHNPFLEISRRICMCYLGSGVEGGYMPHIRSFGKQNGWWPCTTIILQKILIIQPVPTVCTLLFP